MSRESPSAAASGWECAWVGLGSNEGPRAQHLCAALAALRATPEVRELAVSSLYETRHEGPDLQAPHLNAVARFETRLSPQALLARLLAIECASGRARVRAHGAPRTLDLDLLLFGARRIDEPDLVVPHPRLHLRAFVLEPLAELAPRLVHPALGETIEALAARVRDPAAVRRCDPSEEPTWPLPQ
jgi:2-amino-4-hydroxy-6-hydroxymethyldihydropteridine diphosphokinase